MLWTAGFRQLIVLALASKVLGSLGGTKIGLGYGISELLCAT